MYTDEKGVACIVAAILLVHTQNYDLQQTREDHITLAADIAVQLVKEVSSRYTG